MPTNVIEIHSPTPPPPPVGTSHDETRVHVVSDAGTTAAVVQMPTSVSRSEVWPRIASIIESGLAHVVVLVHGVQQYTIHSTSIIDTIVLQSADGTGATESTGDDTAPEMTEAEYASVVVPVMSRDADDGFGIGGSDDDDDSLCTICQLPLLNGMGVVCIRGCGHKFHDSCLHRWFIEAPRCPNCNQSVREEPDE